MNDIDTNKVETNKTSHYEQLLSESQQIQGVSLWQDAWRRLKRNRLAYASLHFLIGLAVLAIITPAIPFQSPIDKDLDNRQFLPPSMTTTRLGSRPGLKFQDNRLTSELSIQRLELADLQSQLTSTEDLEQRIILGQQIQQLTTIEHPFNQLWHELGPVSWKMCQLRVAIFGDYAIPSIFGTDQLGRDLLSRIMWGGRVSLTVGLIATLVSLVIGVSYGAIAGYFGGWVDAIMMRIVDTLYSVPFIFVVIFLVTFLGEDSVKRRLDAMGIDQLMIFYVVIGAIYWLTMSRVVRGQVLSLRNEQFVEAAQVLGASPMA